MKNGNLSEDVGAGSIYKTNYPGLYSYKMRGRRKKKQKLGKEK
jgi:hypothetical protein